MQKRYFDVTSIMIVALFTIIIYPLLATLAHGQQEQQLFPFSSPTTTATTTTKNQINNDIRNESTSSYSFSAHDEKTENNDANVNDNIDANDNNNDNVDVSNPSSDSSGDNTPKAVILNFYDNDIGQFTNAKPILDKYGFKGTFFIVCRWASSDNPGRMTWNEITQLYREGHDIESHSTSHKVLSKLSASDLDYQVGQSKQCLHEHLGVEPIVFSPPHGRGWNNATVIDTIAKYYDLSIGGFVSSPMFLHCYGWKQHSQHSPQTDCSTYSDDGTLNYANRYTIKEVSHNGLDTRYSHDDTQTFEKFVELVNSQTNLNKDGKINAIPIIGYHNIEDDKAITSTDISLFYKEMKYLYDNGFKVLTMSDLGYDKNSNYLYIRNSE
ncbi:MAG: polysaccharide deacetylase family protein [Nitrososphaeraceae archaeon]|jgi:peptidoglycan/xylan/chitin deacetylase (PgdA/CDA1 family)